MYTYSSPQATALDILFLIVLIVGGIVSFRKKEWRYLGVTVCACVTVVSWFDPNYDIKTKFALTCCLAFFSVILIGLIIKRERDNKAKVLLLKKSEYFKQTGVIPAQEVNDPDVLRALENDTSVVISKDLGIEGEYLVSECLGKFGNDSFKRLHNVYIPKEDGTSAEIDLLCITPVGILVIESKNYSGKIYGYDNNRNWVQYIGNNKYPFYNPIMQNRSHIKTLSEYIKIPEEIMTSIVVFSDKCELRKIPESTRNDIIVQLRDLPDLVSFLLQKRERIWSEEKITAIADRINSIHTPSEEEKTKHIQDAKYAKFENLK